MATVLAEQFHDVRSTLNRHHLQKRIAFAVLRIHFGLVRQKQFHHVLVVTIVILREMEVLHLIADGTHFVLDCFRSEQLERLVGRLAEAVMPEARWLLSDFCEPPADLANGGRGLFWRRCICFSAGPPGCPLTGLPRRTLRWCGVVLSFDNGICSSGDFYTLICGICSLRVLYCRPKLAMTMLVLKFIMWKWMIRQRGLRQIPEIGAGATYLRKWGFIGILIGVGAGLGALALIWCINLVKHFALGTWLDTFRRCRVEKGV